MKNLFNYVLVFIVLSSVNIGFAQWPNDFSVNLPVCSQTGEQSEPQIVGDGAGGAIILWADKRDGDIDLYAQRVSKAGYILWENGGLSVHSNRGDLVSHKMVENGNGGAYITWISNDRIYAQQIDSNGQLLWNAPVRISSSTNQQAYYGQYDITYDNNGGLIIVWRENTTRDDIVAQRVNTAGVLLWGESGKIVVDNFIYDSRDPKVAATSNGGAIVFYTVGWVDYNYYLNILNSQGEAQIADDGLHIALTDGRHDIISDGSDGAIITWESDYEIYANRISSSEAKMWGTNGIVVCEAGTEKYLPFIVSDGNNGAYIAWHDCIDYYNYYCDIYAQHLNSSGEKLWQVDGVQVSNTDLHDWIGDIQVDNLGGLNVSWETNSDLHDYYTPDHDSSKNVWVQKINDAGEASWSDGFQISTNPAKKYAISLTGNNEGGIIATWVDERNGNSDIYAQGVDYSSTITGISGSVVDATTNAPIFGAMLILSGPTSDTTWSDTNGEYEFLTSPGTGYSIEASASNYKKEKKTNITVIDGEKTVVEFALQPDWNLQPPTNLQASASETEVSLQWQAPNVGTEEELVFDDGSFENAMGWDNIQGITANGPFVPSQYPVTITKARVAFNGQQAGDQFRVYVYSDPSGTTSKPSSSISAGAVGPITISTSGTFQDVNLSSLNLTLNSGKFYIGVQQLGANPFWIGVDENGSGDYSFIDSNLDGIFSQINTLDPPVEAVFAIRAVVMSGGSSNEILIADNKVDLKNNEIVNQSDIDNVKAASDIPGLYFSNHNHHRIHDYSLGFNFEQNDLSSASPTLIEYKIYRSQNDPVPVTEQNLIKTVSQSITNYDDFDITAGQTYYYVVTAVYDVGESEASNQVQATIPSGPGSVVRIDPSSKQIQKDCSGTINVVVDSVNNLGSFEFTIQYDPEIIQIANNDSVKIGQFLGSTGRSVTPVGPTINNTSGEITFGAFSFGNNPAPSVDQGGILAAISFSAIDSGHSDLHFQEVQLTTPEGNSISNVSSQDGSIQVTSCFWADIDCDGDVDIVDIQLVAGRWNTEVGDPKYDPRCDVDNQGQGDGDIDIVDIQLVAGRWNKPISGVTDSPMAKNKEQPLKVLNMTLVLSGIDEDGNTILDIVVDNARELGAFQFDLVSNNGLPKVSMVDLGELFISSDNVVKLGPEFDEASEKMTFGAYSFGDNPTVTETGVIARIKLDVNDDAEQTLSLKNVKIVNINGNQLPVNATGHIHVGKDITKTMPTEFTLRQNYPNPFNPSTTIRFAIPDNINRAVNVQLNIFNLEGKLVRTLFKGEKSSGSYSVEWDGTNDIGVKVTSGIYFYTITAGDYRATKKMVLAK